MGETVVTGKKRMTWHKLLGIFICTLKKKIITITWNKQLFTYN